MRIVRMVPVRDEADVLQRNLEWYAAQGFITVALDNESSDGSWAILEDARRAGIVSQLGRIRTEGHRLDEVLVRLLELALREAPDALLLAAADEFFEVAAGGELRSAMEEDLASHDVITAANMEFQITAEDDPNEPDVLRRMRFYSHVPVPMERAYRWVDGMDVVSGLSHHVRFPEGYEPRIATRRYVSRHYPLRSLEQARRKIVRIRPTTRWPLSHSHYLRLGRSPGNLAVDRSLLTEYREDHRWDFEPRLLPNRLKETRHALARVTVEAEELRERNRELSQRVAALALPSDDGLPAPMPVIVGAARSGTTLLRLMLDAHPELAIPPETHFVPDVAELPSTGPGLRHAFLHVLTTARTWQDMRMAEEDLAALLEDVDPFTVSAGLRAFYALYAGRHGKIRWGDKTPMYARRLADVERVLPEAHFVHLIRDGRDVALSARDTWAGRDSPFPAQARRWRKDVKRARSSGRRRAHYLEVRYEDLVRDPEKELRRICAFCGLRYADDMLSYHQTAEARLSELGDKVLASGRMASREVRLAIHARTASPPQPQRAGRWRREMSADDLADFESFAGDVLADLGYEAGAYRSS